MLRPLPPFNARPLKASRVRKATGSHSLEEEMVADLMRLSGPQPLARPSKPRAVSKTKSVRWMKEG